MKPTTKRIAAAAMLAALTCVATVIIKIPSPLKGYVNLGDGVVLLTGWLLPPGYGLLAAGLGSALADVFAGYTVYAPATFVIKGIMALLANRCYTLLSRKTKSLPARLISGTAAEIVMILGYLLFEGVLYGFGPSLVNIPANGVQGVAGLVIGTLLTGILEKQNLTKQLK